MVEVRAMPEPKVITPGGNIQKPKIEINPAQVKGSDGAEMPVTQPPGGMIPTEIISKPNLPTSESNPQRIVSQDKGWQRDPDHPGPRIDAEDIQGDDGDEQPIAGGGQYEDGKSNTSTEGPDPKNN